MEARISEDVTGPILEEFYSGRETIHDSNNDATYRKR
jgi:hypothetical protein